MIKKVQANGLEFAYLEEGEGPLVLLVHGFPDTAHTWDALRPKIAAAGFRAVSPFTRGYAPTAIPSSAPNAQTLGEDVLALITALGEEEAFLVGHDWGAVACYAAASLEPEKIRRMVVSAVPHPMAQTPTPGLMWYARHFFVLNLPGAAAKLRKNQFSYIDTLCRRWSPTWDFSQGDLEAVKKSLSEPGSAEAAVSYYHMLRSGKPEDIYKTRIKVPTTAVAGGDEPVVTPAMFEKARRRFDGEYNVVTIPGGHFAHRESPDAFAEVVLNVLKS